MPLTEKQKNKIREVYHNTLTQDIANELGVTLSMVRNFVTQAGLKKDPNWVAENARLNIMKEDHPARNYWIQKGTVPANKGKKQAEYMTPEQIAKTVPTRFKKGQKPKNSKPVGYERITKDGYIEVKIQEPNVFKLKHRVVWENCFGKIPKGHNVQFKDGNPLNTMPENLYLISRSEQLRTKNSMYAKYPKEIQLAIQAKGALNRQINKLTQK